MHEHVVAGRLNTMTGRSWSPLCTRKRTNTSDTCMPCRVSVGTNVRVGQATDRAI